MEVIDLTGGSDDGERSESSESCSQTSSMYSSGSGANSASSSSCSPSDKIFEIFVPTVPRGLSAISFQQLPNRLPQKTIQRRNDHDFEKKRKRQKRKASRKRKLARRKQNEDSQKASKHEEMNKSHSGVNFIVIDDDTSENELEENEAKKPAQACHTSSSSAKPSAASSSAQTVGSNGCSRSSSHVRGRTGKGTFTFDEDQFFNYQFSREAAEEVQERLFREAANRAKNYAAHHTSSSPYDSLVFQKPVFDVATQFPDHWKHKNPYTCLGLPSGADVSLVKSQYRRLARLYHPDRTRTQSTTSKFHAIAVAYSKLTSSADT